MFPDLVPTDTSAGPAPPGPRTTTPALFSPSERAERRFWEFFCWRLRKSAEIWRTQDVGVDILERRVLTNGQVMAGSWLPAMRTRRIRRLRQVTRRAGA